jgi:hypothetical protein
MKFVVKVWNCENDTDEPSRSLEFSSWDAAIEYIKALPAHEGGVVDRKFSGNKRNPKT